MPSLPAVEVTQNWTAVKARTFIGRVSNLTGVGLTLTGVASIIHPEISEERP